MDDQIKNLLFDVDIIARLVVGIGEAAEITGVPQRQIRYWETKGIIKCLPDQEVTTRRYDYANLKKIILIKELLDDGFTLDAAARKVEDRISKINEAIGKVMEQQQTKEGAQ
ncbi:MULTISPECIES: MerR family transcriptional regulator [Paenibacillus]|uniref:MerR family transcriptional regulator n=1 Tax=Paenibacillus radicis (ex Xue et al. 2023) TaxID=2972489 RepID=A0ABT1YMA0_9BACL|nr:MerR family transcriptional regulator [Paenibacillus radicis (ex Xue et al. 2023)]MCR8634292.1 MerR family transcriptional regulator [Paenibacillus radicis (ex Xue et al. 2023)]